MILSPQRYAEVTHLDSCYVIRCCVPEPCGVSDSECEAGFFSLFIRALYGIRLASTYGIPYYVDFGSTPHAYSDPDRFEGDTNFWNYYFRQPISEGLLSAAVINTPYETFPLRIWSQTFVWEMHRIIQNHIELQPTIKSLIAKKRQYFGQYKVLGVHIRRTDHAIEVEPISLDTFKRTIHQEIQRYDKVFVATDDAHVLETMKKEFGDYVVCNDARRSTDGAPLHRNHPAQDRYGLGVEALLDAYCLSFCQKAILLHSNLSYAALLFNPALDYLLLETSKHRVKRLQTSFIYQLDHLGIRLPRR